MRNFEKTMTKQNRSERTDKTRTKESKERKCKLRTARKGKLLVVDYDGIKYE